MNTVLLEAELSFDSALFYMSFPCLTILHLIEFNFKIIHIGFVFLTS